MSEPIDIELNLSGNAEGGMRELKDVVGNLTGALGGLDKINLSGLSDKLSQLAGSMGSLVVSLKEFDKTSFSGFTSGMSSLTTEMASLEKSLAGLSDKLPKQMESTFTKVKEKVKKGTKDLQEVADDNPVKIKVSAQTVDLGSGLKASISAAGLEAAAAVKEAQVKVSESSLAQAEVARVSMLSDLKNQTRAMWSEKAEQLKQTETANKLELGMSLDHQRDLAVAQQGMLATLKNQMSQLRAEKAEQLKQTETANKLELGMSLDHQRDLVVAQQGMLATLKNQTRAMWAEKAEQEKIRNEAIQRQVTIATNNSAGSYSVSEGASAGKLREVSEAQAKLNQTVKDGVSPSAALRAEQKALAEGMRDLHGFARGLSGAFGTLWMTYGSILPLLAGAAIAGGIRETVKAGAELEYQMTFVAQLTNGAKISVEQFGEAMKGSMLTTKDGALGLRALAQAGMDADTALIALPSVINLATVGELSLAQAALTATGIMHAFRLELYELPTVVDVLTKAAAISNTSVQGMTEAMKTASVVADQYHISLVETSATLATLAERNITGTAAGTAFKNMVMELAAPSAKAAAWMKELGINVYDAQNKLLPFEQQVQILAKSLVGLSEKTKNAAINDIFGQKGEKAVAAIIADVDAYTEKIRVLSDETANFASKVSQALGASTLGLFKSAANDLQIVFEHSFESTGDAWANLVYRFKEEINSEGVKKFVDLLATTGVEVVRLGVFLTEHATLIATLASTYYILIVAVEAYKAAQLAAAAASVAAELGIASVAVAATGATVATEGLAAAWAVMAWPVAIVAALGAAFWYLSQGIDAAKEAEDRRNNNSKSLVEQMDKQTAKLREETDALNLSAQTGTKYVDALRKIREEAGNAREGVLKLSAAQADAEFIKRSAQITSDASMDPQAQAAALDKALAAKDYAHKLLDAEEKRNIEETLAMQGAAHQQELKDQAAQFQKLRQASDAFSKRLSDWSEKAGHPDLSGIIQANRTIQESFSTMTGTETAKVKELTTQLGGLTKEADKLAVAITKPTKDKATIASHMKVYADNIAAEQRKIDAAKLAAVKAEWANVALVEDAARNNSLENQATYEAKVLERIKQSGIEQVEALKKSSENSIEDFIGNLSKLKQEYDDTIEGNKGLEKAAERNAEALKKYTAEVKNAAQAESSRQAVNQIAQTTAEKDATAKYTAELLKLRSALYAVEEAARIFYRTEEESLAKINRQTSLDDQLRFASPEARAYLSATSAEMERLTSKVLDYDHAIEESTRKLKVWRDLMGERGVEGLSAAERAVMGSQQDLLDANIAQRDKFVGGMDIKATEAGKRALDKYNKDYMAEVSRGTAEALITGLTDGAEAGKQKMRDLIVAELRKPIVLVVTAMVNTVLSTALNSVLGGAANAAAGGASNGIGSSLMSAGMSYGAEAIGLTGAGSFASGWAAASAASSAGSAAAIGGMTGAAEMAAGSAAVGATAMEGAGIAAYGALGAVPVAGWIALAVVAAYAIFHKEWVSATDLASTTNTYDSTGKLTNSAGIQGLPQEGTANSVLTALSQGYLGSAKRLGIVNPLDAAFSFAANTGREGQNPNFTLGATIGSSTYTSRTNDPNLFAANEVTLSQDHLAQESARVILTALQASELPKSIKGIFDGLIPQDMTTQQITDVLTLAQSYADLHTQLQAMPFEYLKDMSYAAANGLVTAAGGMEQLGSSLGTYYDKFYTTEEKRSQSIKNINSTLAAGGVTGLDAGTMTRQQYRDAVEAAGKKDMSVEANATAYASLLSVAGAFDAVTPAADSAAAAVDKYAASIKSAGEKMTNEATSLQAQLMRAQGNTRGADLLDMGITDPNKDDATRAVVEQYDANQLVRNQINAIHATEDFNRAMLEASGNTSGLAEFDKAVADAALIAAGWTQAQIDAVDEQKAQKKTADATNDFNRAMLEATGNTSGLAAFDQAVADAALITAGWTQTQIDTLHGAQSQAKTDQATSDFNRAMLEATGNTSGLAAFDQAVADAALITAGWTQAQVDDLHGAQTQAKTDQATTDFNRAMLEATGNTSGLAKFDRAVADAALITAGWTQEQVDQVNRTRDTTLLENTNQSWQDQLDVLQGRRTQKQIDREHALEAATDDSTRSLMLQVWAQEDLNAAAQDAVSKMQAAVAAQKEALTTAYNEQSQVIQDALDSVRDRVAKLQTLSDSLKSALAGMRLDGSDRASRQSAQAVLEAALATARKTGVLPVNGELNDALATVKQSSASMFSDRNSYLLDFFKTKNTVAGLSEIADEQLTAEQAAQKVMEDQLTQLKKNYDAQIALLDKTAADAKVQLNSALGINTSILTVRDALADFINKSFPQDDPSKLYAPNPGGTMPSPDDLTVPKLASGTNYVPQDMLAMIHEGEAVVPAIYNPALGRGRDDDALVTELRALRRELADIKQSNQKIADSAKNTDKTLVRATNGGESLKDLLTPQTQTY